jgi:phytoene desaturase
MKKAAVIGSGIAGLASALRLAHKGYHVQVFEANDYPGGKLHAFRSKGYAFDYGPSLFTMPQYVEELFALFDKDPEEHFQYHRKENICNYFWDDGTRFRALADTDAFVEACVSTFGEDASRVKAYLANSAKKYDRTYKLFLEKSLHKLSTYLNTDTLKAMAAIPQLHLSQTLDGVNRRYFRNPKTVQLFNRYATYNGSSPYQTPGIMSLIPQLEMRFGTYYPKGGMHAITTSLYELARTVGVEFHFSEKVKKIHHPHRKVEAVETEAGRYPADRVVCNADVFSAYRQLLNEAPQPRRILRQERSSSALIFYWGVAKSFPQLDLHNIFFSNRYEEEFQCLFDEKSLIDDPTVYINITSKEEASHAPDGCENWFVMINAPSQVGQDWEQLIEKAREDILRKLSHNLGEDIRPYIETEDILDPRRIERDTQSHQGSLYGTSSNSAFAAFLRHPNFSQQIKDLYFCGGSAHPGGGIPLCLLSAKIATDLIPDAV